jgi:hypothetical protein
VFLPAEDERDGLTGEVMSRSYRKSYVGNCDGSGKWKRESNKKIRCMEDVPGNGYYKKLNEVWNSPLETKGYWEDERLRRK